MPGSRVVLRAGAALDAVPGEVERLGLERVLVVSGERGAPVAGEVARALGAVCVGVHAGARMHVPAEVAGRAVEVAESLRADGCVAVGGGSAIGLGKALALRTGLPLVAVPTTYSGSEMTPVWGLTEGGVKRTGRDLVVLPRAVVYDPSLTVGMPVGLSVVSGVNALAHAAEGLYAPGVSPLVALMAEEGVRAMVGALPDVAADPGDLAARGRALYGAWLCGAVLGATVMGLHHKLAHVLGGSFGLPHAETHTVLLPYVLAFNSPAAPGALERLGRALGDSRDPVGALWGWCGRLGAPRSLGELGLVEGDLGRAAELAVGTAYPNPREVTVDGVLGVLRGAFEGREPGVP
ncbi:maleylacetate reductase [Streptomyces roseirectus]|uniref:Maleylacetate reductase n=1 Tax=Streptomyces roseirectus TaxID=2768066 RepID=A0A7H0ITJ7_9ACTN|nr:maleylacetate reductase [Streptomyces roseirectus]QNP76113.1 maleylacetate reductase [Streptomyces roseirectus]